MPQKQKDGTNRMVDFTLQWHITQRCGNHCRHCYMDETNYDLTFKDYSICIENICSFEKKTDFFVSTIAITGGDPLLNPEWFDIAQDIVARKKSIMFLGNPETLSDENLEKIALLSPQMSQLSIDGMRQRHDYLRYNGSFDKTIEGIHKLNKKNIPIGIMFTLSNENVNDLKRVIYFLDSLKIKLSFAFDFVIETGHALNNDIRVPINKSDIFNQYLSIKKDLKSKNSLLTLQEKPSQLFAHKNADVLTNSLLEQIPFDICCGCGAGWRHLTIIKKGDVLACRRMPVQVGNLFSDSFESILLHSPILKNLRELENMGECSTCLFQKFCRGCPAENYAFSSEFFNNKCMWYKSVDKNNHHTGTAIKDEWKKISNVPKNFNILREDKRAYLKSSIILHKKEERDKFIINPTKWKDDHRLNLNAEELGLLLFFVLSEKKIF